MRRIPCFFAALAWLAVSIIVVAPAAGADLELRTSLTYGVGGPDRPAEFIPGEVVNLTMDVRGLAVDAVGYANVHTQVELRSAEGRLLSVGPSQSGNFPLPLGGQSIRTFSAIAIPRTATPGQYKIRVDVRDKASQQERSAEVSLTVLDRSTFGALGVRLGRDISGKLPAGGVFFTGDSPYILFSVGGYQSEEGKVRLRTRLRALDENRRPVGAALAEFTPERSGVPAGSDDPLALYFNMNLNRAGSFVLRLEVEDLVAGKKAEYDLPVVVSDVDQSTNTQEARTRKAVLR